MQATARARIREEEFLALPESNQRIELVDGEVIVAPSATYFHQELVARVFEALRTHARTSGRELTVAQSPLDVRFGPNRILQPDAMVFEGKLPRDAKMPLTTIPMICVEVLSSNRAYDRVTKRYLYAEAGVVEYWIIDPTGGVERRHGEALTQCEEPTDVLRSPLLPGFELDLPTLFAD